MLSITNSFHNIKKYFIIGTVLIIATSCSPKTSPLVSSTQTFTESPSFTLTPKPSVTPTLNPISTQTLTPKPTSTIFISPTTFLTPLPTIPFDEIRNKYEILLATNGSCSLPCFWGMTPGKTTEAELKQFGDQFAKEGYIPLLLTSDGIYTFYYFTHRSGDTTFQTLFFVGNKKIEAMGIKMETATYNFPLSKLLNDFGIPKKIFVSSDQHEGILYMIILYEDQFIAGKYAIYQNKSDKSLYCYDPLSIDQYIVTWAPDKNWLSYLNQEFGSHTNVIPEKSLKLLNEVSDYDISSLYKKLKTPNRSLCIKIKAEKLIP